MEILSHVPRVVLLVMDDPSAARAVAGAFAPVKPMVSVTTVSTGAEALAVLRRKDAAGKPVHPSLIIMDLTLPDMPGQDLLHALKMDADLHRIPVIILTSLRDDAAVVRSYENHANCFVGRPAEGEAFAASLKVLAGFWMDTVRLPP